MFYRVFDVPLFLATQFEILQRIWVLWCRDTSSSWRKKPKTKHLSLCQTHNCFSEDSSFRMDALYKDHRSAAIKAKSIKRKRKRERKGLSWSEGSTLTVITSIEWTTRGWPGRLGRVQTGTNCYYLYFMWHHLSRSWISDFSSIPFYIDQ